MNPNNVKIKVENLKKDFGDLKVLQGVSTEIHEGEVVVVIGPSGSGKSTFLRCLNRLEEASSGRIFVDGTEITDKKTDINRIRERVGMVFQHFNLFNNMNVLRNLTLAPVDLKKTDRAGAEARAMEMLARVGLTEKAGVFPRQLSGGQKQRVAIVRALCMHPEILLFDEVTAALDPEMVREVLEVILQLADQKKTMLIVTHEMPFARAVADRIILLDDGRIRDDTTPEEFFDAPKTDLARRFLQSFAYTRTSKAKPQ